MLSSQLLDMLAELRMILAVGPEVARARVTCRVPGRIVLRRRAVAARAESESNSCVDYMENMCIDRSSLAILRPLKWHPPELVRGH